MTRHDKSIAPRAGRFGFVQHAVTGMLAPPLSSGHTSRALPAERDACNPLWINPPVRRPGSAGPSPAMVIGPALTLPALARGPKEAERIGVKSTPEPVNKANFTQRLLGAV